MASPEDAPIVQGDDDVIACEGEPSYESDPCFRALVQHLPKYPLPPVPAEQTLDPWSKLILSCPRDPISMGMALGVEQALLGMKVVWMRQFLHMSPKRPRGRPKGSGLKQDTEEGFHLWKLGYTPGETRRKLGLAEEEGKKLQSRLRSRIRRLPKEERLALRKLHREERERRRAQRAIGVINPRCFCPPEL